MARHNREGHGEDQLGRKYEVSYQPDWFYQIKVTRDLENGRPSTKTLCRNAEAAEAEPAMPLQRIVVEERPDGTIRFSWRGLYLNPTLAGTQAPGTASDIRWKPPADHPLRGRAYGSLRNIKPLAPAQS